MSKKTFERMVGVAFVVCALSAFASQTACATDAKGFTEVVVIQIVPHGAPRRIDEPAPF